MKYKIYIPSRRRYEKNLTAELLLKHNIDFKLIVEKNDYDDYYKKYGDKVLSLEGSDYGGVDYARNWIKKYSKSQGEEKHWQLDDDIKTLYILDDDKKLIKTNPEIVLSKCEEFTDKYTNVAISGLSSSPFVRFSTKPYEVNKFAYTCFLVRNDNYSWDNNVEDDLDYNLQILTGGDCTLKFNKYCFAWSDTQTQKGGYTDLYEDGKRLVRMKNTLKKWSIIPGIAKKGKNKDKYRLITNQIWKNFKTELKENRQ